MREQNKSVIFFCRTLFLDGMQRNGTDETDKDGRGGVSMAFSLLHSAAGLSAHTSRRLHPLRDTVADHSHATTSSSSSSSAFSSLSFLCKSHSSRLPRLSALRPELLLPCSVQIQESQRPTVPTVRRNRFEEELGTYSKGERCLDTIQGKNSNSSRNRGYCRCCSRAGATRVICSGSSSSSSSLQWQDSLVTMEDRRRILQQKGCVVWITGLSGSGKSTVAFAMDRILNSMSKVSYVLDGDKIREGLCNDLGFSEKDRQENIRRVGETAALFADAGLITVVSFISPYRRDRDRVRQVVPVGSFIEVFMDVPLDVCEKRDAKGLYKLARQGVIKAFTGIDDPYEKPVNPEIVIRAVNEHGVCVTPDEMAQIIIHHLTSKGFLAAE
ncbi:hypothetical protein R1sor_026646 [Riccia sorocarpa]|uniref:Adenylyl-sulfate kinase n=1 Tax=Riccia sorocarpa TaxID=122646 RepID=A0ABD3GBZ6_9MARC